MKKIFNVTWIDDIKTRENIASSLDDYKDIFYPNMKFRKNFVSAKGKSFNEVINDIFRTKEPDIMIVDHFLNQMTNSSNISKGSTFAQILREKWPTCPIIGISAVANRNDIDISNRLVYDDFFLFENFSSKFTTLLVIASNFYLLKKIKFNNIDDILETLKPPITEVSKIKSIIGVDFNANINDLSIYSRLFKWMRLTFFEPGFLYDDLWSATLVGLNLSGFNKFKHKFEKALYKGIFFDPTNVRWWKSILKEIIFKSFPKENSYFPWKVGRNVTKNNSYYSKCYNCGKEYPEIVGYTDDTKKHRVQLHMKCSVPHPNEKSKLFFEKTMVMKGES